jgi:hypothetical protein
MLIGKNFYRGGGGGGDSNLFEVCAEKSAKNSILAYSKMEHTRTNIA